MKIVADESVDKQIVERLRDDGHDVLYVAELDPGIDDDTVLTRSRQANAILINGGQRLWRDHLPPAFASLRNFADSLSRSYARPQSGVSSRCIQQACRRVQHWIRSSFQARSSTAQAPSVDP